MLFCENEILNPWRWKHFADHLYFPPPKIAWALNKGIKPDYKQYWDVELGVTYIPWDKVKPEDLESFCEGGMLDNETLSPGTVFLHVLLLNLSFRVWHSVQFAQLADDYVL